MADLHTLHDVSYKYSISCHVILALVTPILANYEGTMATGNIKKSSIKMICDYICSITTVIYQP